MPKTPSNGRPKAREQDDPELPEGAVLFDSDTELTEEQLEILRSKAESAQKDAQIAVLTAQLLTTRNDLIKAKKTIEVLVEDRDGKKSKRSDKNQGSTTAQGGRRAADKESKPAGARKKRAGSSKSR